MFQTLGDEVLTLVYVKCVALIRRQGMSKSRLPLLSHVLVFLLFLFLPILSCAALGTSLPGCVSSVSEGAQRSGFHPWDHES